jgi:hypothetical protein
LDPDPDPDPNCPVFDMASTPVSDFEIQNALNDLQSKKSTDMDGFSMFFIKQISDVLLKPLKHIFSISLQSGDLPYQLKIAKVVPIFKSGNANDMNNYRPISLLSTFSKILEKIVSLRLGTFLENNNLLKPNQFGFRKGHSTAQAMTKLLNFVSEALNAKKHAILIFCDLRKAFDTCNFAILLKKLQKIGITGRELNWFSNYLTNRQQFTYLNGVSSSLREILNGVPQGSILGPLLFLLYINDLPDCCNLFSILFADDTALGAADDDIARLNNKINTEFHLVCTYFRKNKLSLHPEKTKFILFSNSNDVQNNPFNIYLSHSNVSFNDPLVPNFEIQRVSKNDKVPAIKYLGVFFDPLLNFRYHTKSICTKLSKALYAIKTVKNILPEDALCNLYYALFHCHLAYAIQIWSCGQTSNMNEIEKKQKAAIRVICNVKFNSHTEPLFKRLEILPVKKLSEYTNIQFMQQYAHDLLPLTFRNTWVSNRIRRQNQAPPQQQNQELAQLRNEDDLAVPFARTDTLRKFPLFSLPKIWNEVPADLKFIRNKKTFQKKLKNQLMDSLSAVPLCNRLLCPTCHL